MLTSIGEQTDIDDALMRLVPIKRALINFEFRVKEFRYEVIPLALLLLNCYCRCSDSAPLVFVGSLGPFFFFFADSEQIRCGGRTKVRRGPVRHVSHLQGRHEISSTN